MTNVIIKFDKDEQSNSELSFHTKIVWLGLSFVVKFCQETSKKEH